jgi:ADP-dependent NAD(P)H-hydrate dehydratase / NAD(P)H-hydrate epimerase
MALPPPVIPCDEVALIDEAAVSLGCTIGDLMERAGEALAEEAIRLSGDGLVLVACGPGNNGGDGWVCARHLHEAGHPVAVWVVSDPASPLCREQAGRCPTSVPRVTTTPPNTALIVDAMLGAGAHGRPRSPIDRALTALQQTGLPVLAADVPTGLGTDLVLPATLTLCFQVAKSDLLGAAGVGEFKTVDIGIPEAAIRQVQPTCMRRFPCHHKYGHKGSHGELLVVGGGRFPGALDFACRAAVISGCDLVRAWAPQGPPLPSTIIVHRQEMDTLQPAEPGELTPLIVRCGAVLIGNGIGRLPGAIEAAEQAFSLAIDLGVPVVVDADGLSILADALDALPEDAPPVLVTPHRGEASYLVGRSDDEAMHRYARPNRVVLAKGPVDLVSDGRRWQHNARGNPRLAVGGTGDVLAGLAAGLMARGVSPFDAARMAVLWLTEAGDDLWREQGPCYDALTLLGRLPKTLRHLLEPLGMWPPVV